MNGIKTIGITGGIGSGKSYVSAILQEKFGIPVYDCDKEAKRLTASNENAIIHPVVLQDFKRWAEEQHEKPIVALESAILFESGFNEMVDKVLFVDAPEEVRLRRAMLRDTATEAQIRARMKMQRPELHRLQADFIIDNNQTGDSQLHNQLEKLLTLNS